MRKVLLILGTLMVVTIVVSAIVGQMSYSRYHTKLVNETFNTKASKSPHAGGQIAVPTDPSKITADMVASAKNASIAAKDLVNVLGKRLFEVEAEIASKKATADKQHERAREADMAMDLAKARETELKLSQSEAMRKADRATGIYQNLLQRRTDYLAKENEKKMFPPKNGSKKDPPISAGPIKHPQPPPISAGPIKHPQQPPQYGYGHQQPPPQYGYGHQQPPPQYGYGHQQQPPQYGYGHQQPPPQYGYGHQQPPPQYGYGQQHQKKISIKK